MLKSQHLDLIPAATPWLLLIRSCPPLEALTGLQSWETTHKDLPYFMMVPLPGTLFCLSPSTSFSLCFPSSGRFQLSHDFHRDVFLNVSEPACSAPLMCVYILGFSWHCCKCFCCVWSLQQTVSPVMARAMSVLLISVCLLPSTVPVPAAEQGPDTYLLNKQLSRVTQL